VFDGCVVMLGGVCTVKFADALVALPRKLNANNWYWFPDCACVKFAIVSDGVADPLTVPPSVRFEKLNPPFVDTCHCSVGAGFPLAAPENVVVCPASFVRASGVSVIAGAAFTVSETAPLVTVPPEFVTTKRNEFPLCADVTPITDSVAVLLPEKPDPFVTLLHVVPPFVEICHCSPGAGVPLTTAVKFAVPPTTAVTFPGCVAMLGDTSSVAFALVFDPPVFVATTRNKFVLCVEFAAITVKVALVFPENPLPFVMFVNTDPPFVDTCHCSVGAGVPLVVTENNAFEPAVTVAFDGCAEMVGGTNSVPFVLVVAPPVFVATARNKSAFCVEFAAITVKAAVVTFAKLAPFVTLLNDVPPFVEICHCSVAAGVALTTTVNVAFAPTATVEFAGCVVNKGGTNSVALLLAVVPVALNASARTSQPFSVVFTASADNVVVLFPENAALFVMFEKITPPFVDTCHANVGAPDAATGPNVAVFPEIVVLLAGCAENTGACPHALPHPARAIRPSAASRRQPRPPALIIPLHKDVLSFIMG